MTGQLQKRRGQLQNRRPGRHVGIVLELGPPKEPAPALPEHKWLRATCGVWERFWASPIAQAVDRASDLPRIERWITYVDEWHRALRGFRKSRLVEGSQGQPVLNPLGDYMLKLEAQIDRAEEKFGMTPLDRMRLGISFSEARRSLKDLNAELDGKEGDASVYKLPKGSTWVEV